VGDFFTELCVAWYVHTERKTQGWWRIETGICFLSPCPFNSTNCSHGSQPVLYLFQSENFSWEKSLIFALNIGRKLKGNFSRLCVEKKIQLDATEWFIVLIICSTCFGHLYAHHQELETICVLLPPMVCSAWLLVVGGQVQASRLCVHVARLSRAKSLFLDA